MRDGVANGFYWTTEPWGGALRVRALAEVAHHFFTSSPLRLRGDQAREAREWAAVAASVGVAPDRLVRLRQVHGNAVVVADADVAARSAASGEWPEADILVTDDPTLALAVQVADCVPLLMADPRTGAVGAAHAGWRGTAANVAATAVGAMAAEFGSRPSDLVVVHGPSIGPCCYTVGGELVGVFERSGFESAASRWFRTDPDRGLRLDLWAANRDQLVAAGVLPARIHQAGLCTASHPELFPSYRRDGKGTGRIAGVIRAVR